MSKNIITLDNFNHTLTLRSLTSEHMDKLIEMLEELFKMKFPNVLYKCGLNNTKIIRDQHCSYLPHFSVNEDLKKTVVVVLKLNKSDVTKVFLHVGVPKINNRFLWYPNPIHYKFKNSIVKSDIKNKYPIYILSKGRYKNPLTANYLLSCSIDFKIVVEPHEYDLYCLKIPKKNVLVLPNDYLNLNSGGIPARNFIYNHSLKNKDYAHWILDDNINIYYYCHDSYRIKLKSGLAFRMLEDFMDRYENLYLLGHHYSMFCVPTSNPRMIFHNTRIYSSILIRNDIPIVENGKLWLGKYNEDTDLSLRILIAKLPTVIFLNISCGKNKTGGSGGNTNTIYKEDNNGSGMKKTTELYNKYPEYVKIIKRYNRVHHYINYKKHFSTNKLIFKKKIIDPEYDIKFETQKT